MFFRVLPKAKMQILCESWSWDKREFSSPYLSEKTFAFILAGIPFISTHEYPLQILQKILDLPPHPFYEEFRTERAKQRSCRLSGSISGIKLIKHVHKYSIKGDDYVLGLKKIIEQNSLQDFDKANLSIKRSGSI